MSEHCGTNRGYRLHLTLKQPTCEDCREARLIHDRTRKGLPLQGPMNTPELIEEVQRLVNYGEGEGRILEAVGYVGRVKSLKDRLRKHGRNDLNDRIFWNETVAA